MSAWGWSPARKVGIWRYGAGWLKPFVASAPFLTVALLALLFHIVGGKMTLAKGVLFDLPEGALTDGETTDVVALVMPMRHDTAVFFDDTRYLLGDAVSLRALGEHLAERVLKSERKSLLLLADRRVAGGDLMSLADLARKNGVRRILFAEKHAEVAE